MDGGEQRNYESRPVKHTRPMHKQGQRVCQSLSLVLSIQLSVIIIIVTLLSSSTNCAVYTVVCIKQQTQCVIGIVMAAPAAMALML